MLKANRRFFCWAALFVFICAMGGAAHADVIVIDPAHGGEDFGVRVGRAIEKDITLQVAFYLRQKLQDGGAMVQMTREKDKKISINLRQKSANMAPTLLLVSLHLNAAFDKKQEGFEIYLGDFHKISNGSEGAGGGQNQILGDMLRNHIFNEGVRFATSIEKAMISVLGRKSRGIRQAPMPIFKGASVPTVVIEIGFATNPQEQEKILTKEYQQRIASAIAQGINDAL